METALTNTLGGASVAADANSQFNKWNRARKLNNLYSTFKPYLSSGVNLAQTWMSANNMAGDSGLTNGINQVTDQVAGAVSMAFPAVAPFIKGGQFLGTGLRALTGGTDGMTTFDQIGDTWLGHLTGVGALNAAFKKKTRDFSANTQAIAQVGGSYSGTVDRINNAVEKANKSFGAFSSGARHRANNYINEAERQQNTMTDIANNATDMEAIATNMSDINHLGYLFKINGDYDQRYIKAAKFGGNVARVKKLKFKPTFHLDTTLNEKEKFKLGGTIEWKPVITEKFKEGGSIAEWQPIITESFKDGGKTEETDKKEVSEQPNVIPDGALHKNKHHMENDKDITKKGIPVVDNDGEQQAEIERDELTLNLKATKELEELYHKFYSEETSNKEKDELATEAGKIIYKEILTNTQDNTGLIDKVE